MRLPEKEIIESMLKKLPGSPDHVSPFFSSDAERIEIGQDTILVNIDEFSAEDNFREDKPAVLGWNICIGVISDILASGGIPLYYGHSLSVNPRHWDISYLKSFSEGIARVLRLHNAGFIGGDYGESLNWHYTGICIGKPLAALSRLGAKEGDYIYFTGEVGAGNLEACARYYSHHTLINKLFSLSSISFKPRLEEAQIIRKYASSCIDTSDGLITCLNSLANLNNAGYRIFNIPYLKIGRKAAKILGKPLEHLLVGECGEYELLFTVPGERAEAFGEELRRKNLDISHIGFITSGGTRILEESDYKIDFADFDISARLFASTGEYIEALEKYISGHEQK